MTYTAPLADIRFALREVAGLERVAALPGYEHATDDTVDAVLEEAAKLAGNGLAPLNRDGDKVGAKLENGVVRTAPGFTGIYKEFVDGGWNSLPFDPEFGGQGMPWLLATSVQEMWQAANMGFGLVLLLAALISLVGWLRLASTLEGIEQAHAATERANSAQRWESLTLLNVNRTLAIAKSGGHADVTIADGLRVPRAIGDFLVLRAVRDSGGAAVSVPDADMVTGMKDLGRYEGISAAPEGGAALQALRVLQAQGRITADDTVVVFLTDHGISHARGKQFLYDEGTRIPLVVRGPGIPRGAVRDDLVEHIDVASLTLAHAGLGIPAAMHAQDPFAAGHEPREAVFAARDRCDETVERIRSVRSERFLYIRNFHPLRPHLQPNAYKDGKSIVQALRALHDAHGLDALTERLLFRPQRPAEELYERKQDHWQVRDLAADPAHRADLESLRARLDRWMAETGDRGPEPMAMYDSDMAVYLGGRAGKDKGEGGGVAATARNIARDAAFCRPSVTSRLRGLTSTFVSDVRATRSGYLR